MTFSCNLNFQQFRKILNFHPNVSKKLEKPSQPRESHTKLTIIPLAIEGTLCHIATFENTREIMTAMCMFNVAAATQPTPFVLICSDLPLTSQLFKL